MTLTHDFKLGYSDDETVMLDMNNTELDEVQYWANRAMKWFELGGYLIFEYSPRCYHIVFDRKVNWEENMQIVAGVTLLSVNIGLQRWQRMQYIKMKSTLRVSNKGKKKPPRIVKKQGYQRNRIAEFLEWRNESKSVSEFRFPVIESKDVNISGI